MTTTDALEAAKYTLAFLGGSLVTFGVQSVWSYITRPKLKLVTKGNAGLLVTTPGVWLRPGQPATPEEFFFLRMLVKNEGWRTARSCVAYVSKIIWIDQNENEATFAEQDLIEMQWSWRGHSAIDIPRGAYHCIDLFKFWKSDCESMFCSDRFPSYLQKWGAGGGHLYFFVKVCGDNAAPVEGHVHFVWDGTWAGGGQIVT